MYLCMYGLLLRSRGHIVAQGRERETFQVFQESSAVCS